jgi:Mycobacterium membrane protein
LTNQPDHPQPHHRPDPTAASPPVLDPLSAPTFAPGQAPIPGPDYPPTAQFPAQPPDEPVNYAPPGYPPDYGPGPAHPSGDHPGPAHPSGDHPGPAHPSGHHPGPGYPAAPGQSGAGWSPPPPEEPGYAQGPPPRRSNAPLIAVILAVTLLLCGGVATAGVLIARNVKESAERAVPRFTPPTALPELPKVPELPELPTTVPQVPGGFEGRTIKVTYEVTGDGPVEIVYLDKLGSAPVRVGNAKLPWKFTTELSTPVLLSVTAMRVDSTAGEIGCRTLVDGAEVKRNQSGQGNFASTSCTYFALD